MITKLNTYEGVPIGGKNFEEFLNYVREFLGANFGFSTNVLENQGGFFEEDGFFYVNRTAQAGLLATFFSPELSKESGNLFGKKGTEYYRFNILSLPAIEEAQSYKWEVLATDDADNEPLTMTFANSNVSSRQLPYRPVRRVSGVYEYGYSSVRMNGILQSDYTFSYSNDLMSFATQSVLFERLSLGAESPSPIVSGRYDGIMENPESGISLSEFNSSPYGSRVSFEYTNFSIDFGSHILLWRKNGSVNKFVYIPQDLSSGESVSPGRFKVINYSSGEIELNITSQNLQGLVFDGETVSSLEDDVRFVVISAEQLKEDSVGGITHYYTRYGKIYDGEATEALLLEYIFDGTSSVVREIPSTDYFGGVGDLLLQDSNRRYEDGVVLAVKYMGLPSSSEIERVQSSRYRPDTFQFYYSVGIIKSGAPANDANIRAIIETNPSSWYNRDVLDAEYFPVNRVEETYYSLIYTNTPSPLSGEAALFSDVFDPNLSFKIVDTIGLQSLADVGAVSANQVLVFNGTTFYGADYTLDGLLDVSITNPQVNNLISYNGTGWVNASVSQVVSGVQLTNAITYATGVTISSGSTLVTKDYVDGLVSGGVGGVGGDLTTLTNRFNNHEALGIANSNSAHGSTSASVAGKIMQRDSGGRVSAAVPLSTLASPSLELINSQWLANQSQSGSVPNTLVRRDNAGRFRSSNPVNSLDVANRNYVDGKFQKNTGGSGYIILDSNLVFAWTVGGASFEGVYTITGPTLPSGNYSILNVQATLTGTTSRNGYVSVGQVGGVDGFRSLISGNAPVSHVRVEVVSASTGGSAWSAYIFWTISRS